jgi:outer membrane protein assembly factor BamB
MKAGVFIVACFLGGALMGFSQESSRLRWGIPTGKYVFSSPAVDADGTIYIGSGNGSLYALSPDGTVKWTFATRAEIQSSPAIGRDGTIYFGSADSKVYALNGDGSKKWEFPTGNLILCSPTLGADGTIYIGSRDGRFYALTPDGEEKWVFVTGQYYTDVPAVIGPEGTIFVSAAGTIHALKHNGEERWARHLGTSDLGVAMAIGPGGTIYASLAENGPNNTLLFALNHRGEIQWQFTCGQITAVANPPFPAVARDGTIYLATPDSFLYAIRPDGTLKWKVPATRSQAGALLSNDGKIYLNSSWDFRFLCYDLNGALVWQHQFGTAAGAASGLISSFPVLRAGIIYVGSGNGSIYAIKAASELEEGGWPAFGRDLRHSGRDLQRGIEALMDQTTGVQQLRFDVEPGRPYVLQGSSDLLDWVNCTNFTIASASLTLPRIGNHPYYRLATQ